LRSGQAAAAQRAGSTRLAIGGRRRSIGRVVAQRIPLPPVAPRRSLEWLLAPPDSNPSTGDDLGRRPGAAPARADWQQAPSPQGRRRVTMITYIGLLSFTEKGIQGVKDTTKRAAAAKEVAKRFGVNMRDIYWTLGEYDMVCVLEADDEQALTAFNLATAMQGNVRTQSLRAFGAAEMDKVLAKLP
jgi:uncharacterized protein with GYD domain